MKLMYHRELQSYLMMNGNSPGKIEDGVAGGVFFEKLDFILFSFCNSETTWLREHNIESELELVAEFDSVQDLKEKFAEYLI